jgi:hypothetical protein
MPRFWLTYRNRKAPLFVVLILDSWSLPQARIRAGQSLPKAAQTAVAINLMRMAHACPQACH